LQVIPALDTGGAERTTIDIARALVRDGLRSVVATTGGRLEPLLAATGSELVRLPVNSKAPQTIAANALRLARLIRVQNVKLIHARSRAPAWSAALAAKMEGIAFVTTYHGIYNASNPLKRFYNSVMVRADAVIAKSAQRERGMDFILVADEEDAGDFLVFLQGALHAGDDDTAAVVTTHDIHCDSHR